MKAHFLELITAAGLEGNGAAGGFRQGGAVVSEAGVVNVFVGEIGSINRFSAPTAGG